MTNNEKIVTCENVTAPCQSKRPDIKVVYISGPMTGRPDYNHPNFNRVANRLRAAGYRVINPAERTVDSEKSWGAYIGECLDDIKGVQESAGVCGMLFLDGFAESDGSCVERALGRHLGWYLGMEEDYIK